MANLKDGSRVYGDLTVDNAVIAGAGAGFQNMVLFTTGSSATYTFPSALQVAGVKFKVTIVGAGGSGGNAGTTASLLGGGGGAGGAVVVYSTVVSSVYSFTYTIDSSSSSITYNSFTYTASAGSNGTLNASGGAGGSYSNTASAPGTIIGWPGQAGGDGGTLTLLWRLYNKGGDSSLGLGYGAVPPASTTLANGNNGKGYGSGGSGGITGSTAGSTAIGGSGAPGIIILEY